MRNTVGIVGKVNQDLSMKALKTTDLGRDGEFLCFFLGGILGREKGGDITEIGDCANLCTAEFAAISAMVDATDRYKEPFYMG